MKLQNILVVFILALLFGACNNSKPCSNSEVADDSTFVTPTFSLAEFLYKNGNMITNNDFPYLVTASEIYFGTKDNLLIDIRDTATYSSGHIEGAYNVAANNLMAFLQDSVNTAGYNKVYIIDETGPAALYIATLLRFNGYNAYGLKFGMGAWNKKFASVLKENISNKYANIIETQNYDKPASGQIKDLESGNIIDFISKRSDELISNASSDLFVSIDDVVQNPDNYFLIAYWTESTYSKGHLPNSIMYNIRSELSYNNLLNTLPTDKTIVVYCHTGHHAAAITAYLRLLGYDAKSVIYGANSFMNVKFRELAPGAAIVDVNDILGDYPLLEGNERVKKSDSKTSDEQIPAEQPVAPVIKQNNQTTSVGGCG